MKRMKIVCDRCNRKTTETKCIGWNCTVRRGIIVGYLCPACQTSEENAEAEINEATLDYQGRDAFGRYTASAKGLAS